jgi:hypothetical protein
MCDAMSAWLFAIQASSSGVRPMSAAGGIEALAEL